MGKLLQLMRRPVAEVQGPRGAKLEGVATRRDVVKVQLRAAVNQPEHGLHISVNESICLFLDEVEELDIFEQCHLDSLRDTTAPVTRGQRHQKIGIVEHGHRGRKCAEEVLLPEGVDTILDAYP